MFKGKSKLVSGIIATSLLLLVLSACGKDNNEGAAAATSPASSSAASTTDASSEGNSAIQEGTSKLQDETSKLQEAVKNKDAAEVKRLGKSVNDAWLAYENSVRQLFPLEYTEIEKYVMPIFSASAFDKVDFEALTGTAAKLQDALTALKNAKPTTGTTSELLTKAVANYKVYVQEQADGLVSHTKLFVDAVKAGNIEEAKSLYSKARVYFETIEPIAESFGDLDPRIDARLADAEDPNTWGGFHRIEKALWVDNNLQGMDVYADQLLKDTQELSEKIKSIELEPKTVVAGAIELLNEAATSKITGEEELYSHTDLVDFAANVSGSKSVYLSIIPALNEKNPELGAQLDKQFQQLEQTLLGHQENGQYISYDKLTTEQIRKISDELSVLSSLMTQTASIL
ncbi:Efem/EfeO family lipoprotein [Cohnella endophytica]|uniref:Efem/EfeO family lipoprotein n=1 Tax=Cohnella endophytica TaxID=2419778 RepID=A0A494YBG4_9BACL|nr:iron uptake system protein EfeO [Cohnella endophytica]RKP57292.1 Efem/EfeO family lipoprotein [Cohnella endophytica]